MAKNTLENLKPNDEVFSKVHDMDGTILEVVPEPEDGHHATFAKVRLTDGRVVHLTDAELD